jgi:hypothetical protein
MRHEPALRRRRTQAHRATLLENYHDTRHQGTTAPRIDRPATHFECAHRYSKTTVAG